jgi:hypothetical protein
MEYKTKTMEQTAFTANLSKLPLMKNLDSSQIVTNVDTFRKGEKNLFWFIKLAVFGAIAYGIWVYVLPVVMVALGQLIALAATGVFIVFMVLMAPVILKGLRLFTRNAHKALIKYDPFAQLEIERQKMLQNQQIFRIAQQNIIGLRQDMELEASKAEKEAEDGQKRILGLQAKAGKIKASMDEMQQRMGVAAKGEDEYVQYASDLQKVLAESQRVANQINQNKDFTEKFGSRGNVMKKLSQKLTLVETAMDIKIQDFDATVIMLKKDYSFAQKANAATTAAKSVLGFSNGWEMDYALDSVVATIAADTAMTAGNLKDIESITSKYSLDSDELYANLNLVADKIKVGEDIIPSAKQYRNPEYRLTSEDKLKSGGFGDMF